MRVSRRKFLGTSAAAVVAAGTMTKGKVFGANDKIRMCVIGLNGRGGSHIEGFTDCADSEITAICDPDEHVLEGRAKEIEKKTGKRPATYVDMRDVMADDSIDAVSIATPNHWHALATIWACQAGKDVYVEKPATHEVWEGRQLVAAAKKYNRIVQHGTQNRSSARWMRDIALLQSGEIIGPVYMARGLGYKNGNRGSLGFRENEEPPKHLHWRLWQGPASEKPYNSAYVHYNWHWFWHYGNGEIGNQGIHQLDVSVWGMNRGFPVKVHSAGGRYTYDDMGETPNTNIATFTYADGSIFVFEVRNRFTNREGGNLLPADPKDKDALISANPEEGAEVKAVRFHSGVGVGNLFYADGGYYVDGQGFYDTQNQLIPVDEGKYPYPKSAGCWQNFLNAVKSRKQEDIFGGPMDCHLSSGHAHLANIAYRLGHSLEFDPQREEFKDCPEANALLKRDYHPDFVAPTLA